jgi:long-subunit acyl-CoA synthetase (AMP-forming)
LKLQRLGSFEDMAGGLPNVVVSPNVSDLTLLKILTHSRCRAVFTDGVGAPRVLALKAQLLNLSHLIVMNGAAKELPGTISFVELLERGRRCHISQLDRLLEAVQPDDLATIMYTSGSTGEPKGVMRAHDNLLSNIAMGGEIVLSKADELSVIVLSLNHLFGRYGFLKSAVTGRTTAMIEATELNLDLSVIQALRPTVSGRRISFNCADGSNIYPGNIEAPLENDSFIRQAVLLGDRRPFIAALIVPDRRSTAAALGRTRTSLSDGDIETVLRQRVDLINNQLDDYQKIRKVAVLSDDFPESIRSIAELQKIKIDRQAVEEGYRKEAADS